MMEMLIFYCFYKHFLRIPAKKSGRPPAGRSAYSQSEKFKSNQKRFSFSKEFFHQSKSRGLRFDIWTFSNQKSLSPIRKVQVQSKKLSFPKRFFNHFGPRANLNLFHLFDWNVYIFKVQIFKKDCQNLNFNFIMEHPVIENNVFQMNFIWPHRT